MATACTLGLIFNFKLLKDIIERVAEKLHVFFVIIIRTPPKTNAQPWSRFTLLSFASKAGERLAAATCLPGTSGVEVERQNC